MDNKKETLRINRELLDSAELKNFWTPEKCRLLALTSEKFSPSLKALLEYRRTFKQGIDSGKETLKFPEDATIRRSDWTVSPIPAQYLLHGPELVSPLRDSHMAINAAKAHGQEKDNGLVSTIFDNCDAGHYAYTIRGVYDLCKVWSGEHSADYNNIHYHYSDKVDGMGVWWFRVNGLGAAPLDTKEIAHSDGSAIYRTLFEIVFYASHALDLMKAALDAGDEEKAVLLAPKIYVPKLEFAKEAQWINDVCAFIEEQKNVPRGSIKIGLVVETPTIIYELDETCWALKERFVKASFGRYDALAAAIAINCEHLDKLPPGPHKMGIKTLPAKEQFEHMLRVLHRRGVYAIGGMDVPVGKDNEKVYEAIFMNKVWEGLFVYSAWISAPAHTLSAAKGLAEGAQKRRISEHPAPTLSAEKEPADGTQKSSSTEELRTLHHVLNTTIPEAVLAVALNTIPKDKVTNLELDFLIRIFIEFAEGYLRGIGCCSYYDPNRGILWPTMEDFATAGEYPVKVIYAWLKHGQTIHLDDSSFVLRFAILEKKVADILTSIKQGYDDKKIPAKGLKMSISTYEEGYYPQAALLFLATVSRDHCVTFVKDDVCWPAYQYLQSLKSPQRHYSDDKSWSARILGDPQAEKKYTWYSINTKQPLPRLTATSSQAVNSPAPNNDKDIDNRPAADGIKPETRQPNLM